MIIWSYLVSTYLICNEEYILDDHMITFFSYLWLYIINNKRHVLDVATMWLPSQLLYVRWSGVLAVHSSFPRQRADCHCLRKQVGSLPNSISIHKFLVYVQSVSWWNVRGSAHLDDKLVDRDFLMSKCSHSMSASLVSKGFSNQIQMNEYIIKSHGIIIAIVGVPTRAVWPVMVLIRLCVAASQIWTNPLLVPTAIWDP